MCGSQYTGNTGICFKNFSDFFLYFEEIYDDITWKSDSLKSHAIITRLQHVSLQERGWFYETESQ